MFNYQFKTTKYYVDFYTDNTYCIYLSDNEIDNKYWKYTLESGLEWSDNNRTYKLWHTSGNKEREDCKNIVDGINDYIDRQLL